jgi:acyl-coenzyme A synthetase/AMP-(fatty) acid ligase
MIYAYYSPEAAGRRFAELKCAAFIAPDAFWQEPTRQGCVEAGAVGIVLGADTQTLLAGTQIDRAVEHRAAAAEPGIALLTSGTTGPPKTYHLSYALVRRAMVLDSPVHAYGSPASRDPYLQSSPLGNTSGLYAWLPTIVAGQPMILLEKFSLETWLDYIREWRPETTSLPGPAFRTMMDMDIPADALDGVKYMVSGASPLEVDLQAAFEDKYGVIILPTFGATEFGGGVAVMTAEQREKYGPSKRGSVGQVMPGVEVRIVDPTTRAVLPPGTEGELEVRAPRLGPDWTRTTDLMLIDEDGFLYHRGRTDGAIMRGGFKINPNMVRMALLEHPAILDAVVTGIPDRRLGEVPVAAYKIRSQAAPPSQEELKAHLRTRLPATFLPTRYRQVDELPTTRTHKLDLGAVRAMFAEAAAG